MLIACWSPKGGSGTTVVSVALAALASARSPGGALVVALRHQLADVQNPLSK